MQAVPHGTLRVRGARGGGPGAAVRVRVRGGAGQVRFCDRTLIFPNFPVTLDTGDQGGRGRVRIQVRSTSGGRVVRFNLFRVVFIQSKLC
jgi:hypothetical protein